IHYYWSPQPGWAAENLTQYQNIGTTFRIANDPVVINLQSGDIPTQHAFARNGNGDLIHYYWSPEPGWAAENLTQYQNIGIHQRIASDTAVVNLASGHIPTQHAFARNGNGDLIHYYWSSQPSWAAENLTQYQNIGTAFRIANDPRVISSDPRPLTVIGNEDDNGFLKDPIWGYQWNNNMRAPKVSDVCPSYNRAADWTTALTPCTSDSISVDTQKTRTTRGSCTPGHYNWAIPVTYEGQIFWQDHSTGATIFQFGGDDDY